jgi:hypothetical protein
VGRVRTKLSTEYVHSRVSTPPESNIRLRCSPLEASSIPAKDTRFPSLLPPLALLEGPWHTASASTSCECARWACTYTQVLSAADAAAIRLLLRLRDPLAPINAASAVLAAYTRHIPCH